MEVPIISFNSYFGSKEEKCQVAEKVFKAFTETGFVVLVDHGVSTKTIQDMFIASKEVHQLDKNIKEANLLNPETGTGYSTLGTEKLHPDYQGWKEAWTLQGKERAINLLQPYHKNCILFTLVGKIVSNYWTEFENLFYNVLNCISIQLNIEKDYLKKFCIGGDCSLRLINYPPIKKHQKHNTVLLEGEEYYVRAGEHTDFGVLTFLVQESPGLQLKTRQGKWLNVPFIKNSVVINVADLLMRWSNDILVSTPHRVVANVKDDVQTRWSIGFFCLPRGDATISTLPNTFDEEHPEKYEPVNAWEYILNRLKGVVDVQQSKL
eukprot:snap_masked-scaffold_37-processed-gene-2.70-mRNA-1 protein AED:0.42 eAED:0.42 QI:0/0/0/0.33/1/1/3/0/320